MRNLIIAVLVIGLVAIGLFGYTNYKGQDTSYTETVETETAPRNPDVNATSETDEAEIAAAAGEETETETEAQSSADSTEEPTESDETDTTEASATIDLKSALAPRSLGDPDAPVKIEEFASLTCSHCGHFHKDTFPTIKSEFIDEGVVHFTYTDYPLNGPALDAAMLSRCLPEKHYFKFIKLLFDTQEDWAYKSDYKAILRQNAKLLGASDELVDACWKSAELRKAIYDRIAEANEKHSIKSTPSFVVNGELKVKGAKPIGTFREVIKREAPEL